MEYTLKLSDQHLVVIGKALEEIPFRLAAPIFDVINAQCAEQKQPDPVEPKQEKK